MSYPKDYVGMWFPVMEDLGDCMRIPIGKTTVGSKEVHWQYFSHAFYDGVSALGEALQNDGYQNVELPAMKEPKKPSLWQRLCATIYHIADSNIRHVAWKRWNPDIPPGDKFQFFAWRVFTEEETQHILTRAKSLGVTVNNLLLYTLNKVIEKDWLDPSMKGKPKRWSVPVSMRGAIALKNQTANHSIFIGVDVADTDDVAAIQKNIHHLFHKKHAHWGCWRIISLVPRLLGVWGPRFFLGQYQKKRHAWVGCLSNLGLWKIPTQKNHDPKEAWLVCIPVLHRQPVSAGCLTVHGKMSISLNIHRFLAVSRDEVEQSFASWVTAIL